MGTDWNPNELVGTQLGSCVLERTLGVGGMGAVYLAQQIRPRRQVAVKVLQPGRSTSAQAWEVFLERFRREADIAAGLDHANIVPIYEFGQDGDVAFLVMPYLPDGSLADLLLRAGCLPLSDALPFVDQVAAALDYAHANGLVHRDVKPSNLLLHPDGRLMLADFGIACSADDTARSSGARGEGDWAATGVSAGMPAGTPEYMAPEQVRGAALSPATDIYALGIVTYAMLTGETPFGGVERHMILARQLHEPPASVRMLRPDIAQRVDETIVWALAKDPSARPPTAMGFARALRSAAARSRPLSSLFARSGDAAAPRGVLQMAADLVGMTPPATPGQRAAPSRTLFTSAKAGSSAGRPPIPRRDNGTRPLDRGATASGSAPGRSQPHIVAASYESAPMPSSGPVAPPFGEDAAPTLGPGYPGTPYSTPYAPPYVPGTYPGLTSPAWPGSGRPPAGPPPRRPRRHSALKFATGLVVVVVGCMLLLGTLGRTGLFAQTSPISSANLPTPHLAPTATTLPTPTPTVPPNWVRVTPASLTLTCKSKSAQAQITIRNLGKATLAWHIDASNFSGLQFSKTSGNVPAGKSTTVTAADHAWWDVQGTFAIVPDTDGAGDPATISYSAQGCPWGPSGG